MFNPETFLNTTHNEAADTSLLPVPEGEFIAVSSPVTAESFRTFDIKRGERAGTKGMAVDIEWTINDDEVKSALGRTPKVRQSIMIDTTADGNGIDFGKGKNVGLGRLRQALNQNQNGQPWSFAMLGNQVAKVKVKHRMHEDKIFAEVSDVAAAG
jgi:hypothetical protein